ncbi:hypothetical protein [Mesorhizobium sp. M0199]|uniref:hypothetical protein n=1 Tax=Mesorhizobium sp. M0199 TaxID=2956911 RepID=UPI00333978A7
MDSFIILPPSGARSQSALRGVEAFLKSCFPEQDLFQRRHLAFDGDYQVLPICGVGGDEPGRLRVLECPTQWMGIAAALKAFRLGRPPAVN